MQLTDGTQLISGVRDLELSLLEIGVKQNDRTQHGSIQVFKLDVSSISRESYLIRSTGEGIRLPLFPHMPQQDILPPVCPKGFCKSARNNVLE